MAETINLNATQTPLPESSDLLTSMVTAISAAAATTAAAAAGAAADKSEVRVTATATAACVESGRSGREPCTEPEGT
jgi:hypothetical protein